MYSRCVTGKFKMWGLGWMGRINEQFLPVFYLPYPVKKISSLPAHYAIQTMQPRNPANEFRGIAKFHGKCNSDQQTQRLPTTNNQSGTFAYRYNYNPFERNL